MPKYIATEEEISKILSLFSIGYGTRAIASELGLTRTIIIRIFKNLNIKNKKNVSRVVFLKEKKCSGPCGLVKSIDEFYKSYTKSGAIRYKNVCKSCNTIKCNEYIKKNHKKVLSSVRQYRQNNKEKINKNYNRYTKERFENDPAFKLRRSISSWVAGRISKNGKTWLKCLNYTVNDLKNHLEKQFEPWMNWGNRGKFDPKTWDDNDTSTWKWQLDHIIPHSDLPYNDVEDENFKKCWALENLRPLSAKQNVIDGTLRIRHKKNK